MDVLAHACYAAKPARLGVLGCSARPKKSAMRFPHERILRVRSTDAVHECASWLAGSPTQRQDPSHGMEPRYTLHVHTSLR